MAVASAAQANGFDSYITGLRAHATPEALRRLQPGTALRLRPSKVGGPNRLEVCTTQGEPLGWLPMEDSMAMATLSDGCDALVTALVPARQLPRVHIRVFTAS